MIATAVSQQTVLRQATSKDLPALHALIHHYSEQGILLPRTKADLRTILLDFRVVSTPDKVLACAVLHYFTPRIAEVRSLAVAPDEHGGGHGRRLVEALIEDARRRGAELVFAFTYATEFFHRLGFEPIDRGLLPWKVWTDCYRCPKRHCCDEIAVARWLKPPPPPPPLVVISS